MIAERPVGSGAGPMGGTRIVLVDDEPLIRAGVRTILEATGGNQVVAEAGDGMAALIAVRTHVPDVVILDIRMPGMDGLSAAATIRATYPDIGIIMLTTFGETDYVVEAMDIGVDGFVLKSGDPAELGLAVTAARSDGAFFSPQIATQLVHRNAAGDGAANADARRRVEGLTRRELEILQSVARGSSNAEIAEVLHLSVGTVKWYVTQILRSLGAANRVEAALISYRAGLVE